MGESVYKQEYDFRTRRRLALKVRRKQADRIPPSLERLKLHHNYMLKTIVEKDERSDIPDVQDKIITLPADMTVDQFAETLRNKIRWSPEKPLFISFDGGPPPLEATMSAVYEECKDEDGFLYIMYSG